MKRTARRAAPRQQPRQHPGQRPHRRRYQRWIWGVLLVLALLAGAVYALRVPLLVRAGRMLVASDRLEKADAAVVLGGENDVTPHRVDGAIWLYQHGWVSKIVLSGPQQGFDHESDLSQPVAVAAGVPRQDIFPVPNSSGSTLEEAHVLSATLQRLHVRSLYVVTSNFHTARARRIWRHAVPGTRVLTFPVPSDWYDPDRWWESRRGRFTFMLEAVKTMNSAFE